MLRLRESYGPLELVNARDDHPLVSKLAERGYNLNEGIALVEGEKVFFADECMHRLALLSTPSSAFNRLNAAILRSPRMAAIFYPALRTGRILMLWILRRERLIRKSDTT